MWNILWWIIMLIYVPASLGLIVVVLLQKGKGVGFAGAFGAGGGADTVFGPRSSKSLPQKLTYTMAGLFMTLALVLSLLTDKVNRGIAPEQVNDPSVSAASTIEDALTGDLDEAPAAEAPVVEAPAAEAPATETPAATPPVVELEQPAAGAPEDAPAEAEDAAAPAEAPADEAPAVEAPAAEEAPVEDAAGEETPAP